MEEGKNSKGKSRNGLSASFITGAIALAFLIIGYEMALFIHKAAVTHLVANRDHPDTVYVIDEALARRLLESETDHSEQAAGDKTTPPRTVIGKPSQHSSQARKITQMAAPRSVESFRFNPNTVSVEDLQRLGFSEKQAQAIDHYRQKGGKFRRKEDFARSFVVADSVYERLAPFIDIPRLDINKADSVALLALPGIGPYFAGKVVSYRERLGGYSFPEQLMDIYHFDQEKYDGLKDLITCSEPKPYPLWTLPEDQISGHPYISSAEAHGIVLYREHHSPDALTVEGLRKAGVISEEHAALLSRCRIE